MILIEMHPVFTYFLHFSRKDFLLFFEGRPLPNGVVGVSSSGRSRQASDIVCTCSATRV